MNSMQNKNKYIICDYCLLISNDHKNIDNICYNCYIKQNWNEYPYSFKLNYYVNKIFKCYII